MPDNKMKRSLKSRHIQMIGLGSGIGTGIFYSSASTIGMAGPSIILSYLIDSILVFLVVKMLGEMSVEEPVSGSFSYYAKKYWGDFPSFLAGWNYWFLYIMVGMMELTAVAIYVAYWFPTLPQWISTLICLVVITLINLTTVKAYGEMTFWMTLIKIFAIVFMIVFGAYLIFTDVRVFPENFSNIWIHGGFFPNGIKGTIMTLAPVILSFAGLELLGITACEAENPEVTIPSAINKVFYSISIFYLGTMTVIVTLWPWNKINIEASPFVQIFDSIGISAAANLLNVIVLIAAASVYNSALYANSRMLYGMAKDGNAPKIFFKLSKGGVPINSVITSVGITFGVVLLNYFFPGKVFNYIFAVITGAFIICWIIIILTHLRFRKHCEEVGLKTKFRTPFYPFVNYASLAFVAVIVVIMTTMDTMRLAVIVLPIWLFVIWLLYKYQTKKFCQKPTR